MIDLGELIEKKELVIKTEDDRKKINLVKEIMSVPDWMFRNSGEVVVEMLDFLDVPKDKIKEYYLDLISVENFMTKRPIERI